VPGYPSWIRRGEVYGIMKKNIICFGVGWENGIGQNKRRNFKFH